MTKLIFTSRYLKDAKPSQKENYVHYIGTRKGVEKIDTSKKHLPATVSQKKLVHQLLQDFPATKEMLEYEDYQRKPTIENASEFIFCALEQNLDIAATRKNYVDYLAHRPRVEKIGEHGLFTDEGEPVVLGQVQNQVADHKGIVWTHVISLRREDAARLGYDSAVQWMALLRSKRAMLCKHMKIDSANLKWYAAFHNESHHPHVHLLVYSVKDGEGYLTKQSIEAMRSELAHDIFRQDFANIYEEQAQSRMDLKERSEVVMKTWIDEIRAGTLKSSEIETSMMQLSKRLQNTGGKKVYGYLKRDVKDLVDHIVDELEKDDRVSALYREWGLWQDEIVKTYRKQTEELPPLSKQPKLPPTHKAKWFAGAALNSADQAMASVLSTTMSRLNAFLDSEMEQILCFESTLDTETFCREKSAIFIVLPEEDNTKYFMVSLFLQQLYREMLTIADEHGGKLPNRVMMFADEIGTIPKIESMEMMFSAGRSRRISMVPIIQSFAQLEKNYGKEGSSIIIDNCQDILFGGFAPNSESAEILSKALGNRTVLSGSISRGKNDPSQSLQMMSRPLMAPEELKTLPKGNFILAKTGVCPMKTRLPLFLKWGIRFEEVYEVPEQAAREVVYADRLELEEEIVRRSDFDEEDLWRGSVESGKLEEASFLGGKAHGETAKEKQHKAATRRLPLRTD